MNKDPRLDTKGALHHVMSRAISNIKIFSDDSDCSDFLSRMLSNVHLNSLKVFAWVLMPSHFHFLVETGNTPLSVCMHKILTGFAKNFNRKHGHSGHVFRSRYKSILVDRESYFLELIRYIHLNPVRKGLVKDVNDLSNYPWSGHLSLISSSKNNLMQTEAVLERFGSDRLDSIYAYVKFLEDGLDLKEQTVFKHGCYSISNKGLTAVNPDSYPEQNTRYNRILGSHDFSLKILEELRERGQRFNSYEEQEIEYDRIINIAENIAKLYGISVKALRGSARSRKVSSARSIFCAILIDHLGISQAKVSRFLSISDAAVLQLLRKGRNNIDINQLLYNIL